MSGSELLKLVTNSSNIYSLIVYVFSYLQSEKAQIIHKKYRLALKDTPTHELNAIDSLISELLIINQYEYKDWVEVWKEEFKNTKLDSAVFCYIFLLKIDEKICELKNGNNVIDEIGPLNDDDEYYFYFKPISSFFLEKFINEKIRKGRQTVEYDINSINYDFKNFEVIKNTKLNDYLPVVCKYKNKFSFGNNIHIGFASVSKDNWFEEEYNHTTKEITVMYDTGSSEKYNMQICKFLKTFDEMGIDIAVFPELAMNYTTEQDVSKFILNTNFNNLKFIFLGSTWNNNINEAVLINSQGSVLLREQKNVPYKKYNKSEKCYYTEAILTNNTINFIDIDGLGRFSYLICADFNDLCLGSICSIMHTDFVFVSAFSNSTNSMLKTAKSNAELRGCATIMCNSCAAYNNDDDALSSFIVVPDVCEKQLIQNTIHEHKSCFGKANCELCVKKSTINK